MSPFMVTDLRDLEPEDPTVELPPAARRLRTFLGEIARAASVRESGSRSATALRCRRRPGRKPCKGRIDVFRRDIPPEVEWRCPLCEDGGVVSGWQETYWDLSGTPSEPTGDPEGARVVEIGLSEQEYELLKDRVDPLELESERIVAGARPAGTGRVVMSGRLDDWDFLFGEVALEANHADDRRLQRRLDTLVARLDAELRQVTRERMSRSAWSSEPRPDVEAVLEKAFPDGMVEPLWLEASWLVDAWDELRVELGRLRDAPLLHVRPPREEKEWSRDEDEIDPWDEPGWDEPERSYGLFFLGPKGEGFRFGIESEFLDEEGRLHATSGVGRIGWAVAVSAVAPFALLRVRSLDTEDGVPSPLDIETRWFDEEAGRPQPEEVFLREMLSEREREVLDDLRERIVGMLKSRDVATLTEEEVAMPIPWLRASEEVFADLGSEGSLTVEDGLFFRCL